MHLTARLPRETGRDYALRTLKDNIIRLELPPGSMVSENELAAEMGLSRTPVREALIELSKVKIVEIYPQKGSAIARIDYELVEEAQFMRKVLEGSVVELDCDIATPAQIERLRDSIKLQTFYVKSYNTGAQLLELDDQFHQALFEIAEKPHIFTLMRNIAIHFDRVRNMTLTAVTGSSVVSDHTAIVAAISSKNHVLARSLMEEHLERYRIADRDVRKQFPQYFK